MSDRPEVHQSHLGMFHRCQRQFQFRYGKTYGIGADNIIIPPGVAALIGTATHASIDENLKHKIANDGVPLLPDEALDVARDAANARWAAGEVLLTEEEAANQAVTKGNLIDVSVLCAAAHYDKVAPTLNPLAVEEEFTVLLPKESFDLGGRLDIREKNVLRDTKTASSWPAADYANNLQNAHYSLGMKVNLKRYPSYMYNDVLVKPRWSKAKQEWGAVGVRTVKVRFQKVMVDRLLERIRLMMETVESIREGKIRAAYANPDHWVCTRKYCGYHKMCPGYTGR